VGKRAARAGSEAEVSRALRSCCSGADFHAKSGRGLVFLVASLVGASLGGVTLGAQASRGNVQDSGPPAATSLSNGRYCALVIGNNHYGYMGRLETAANDANAVAKLLQERYGFTTRVLLAVPRDDIFTNVYRPWWNPTSEANGQDTVPKRGIYFCRLQRASA
jgi:hypothetical protein